MSIVSGTTGAVMGANAMDEATEAQSQSAREAKEAQLQMFEQSRADFKPFLEPSSRAMATLLSGIYGGPQTYTDATGATQTAMYQPTESEGAKYIKERTLDDLGRQLRAIGRGSSTVAANAYGRTLGSLNAANEDRYMNQILNLAKIGQGAAGSTGTLGQNTASNLSNLSLAQGNALAQGGLNKANLYAGLGQQSANAISSGYQGYKIGQGLGWWGGAGGAGAGASGAAGGAGEETAAYLLA